MLGGGKMQFSALINPGDMGAIEKVSSLIFDIPLNQCTNVEQTREIISGYYPVLRKRKNFLKIRYDCILLMH